MAGITAAAIIGGAALAGGGIAAYGSMQAAKSQNKGADAARRLYQQRTDEGMVRNVFAAMGRKQGMEYLRNNMPQDSFDAMFGSSGADIAGSQQKMQSLQGRLDQIKKTKTGKMSKADKDALGAEKARLQSEYNGLRDSLRSGQGSFDANPNRQNSFAGDEPDNGGYIGEAEGHAATAQQGLAAAMGGYNADTEQLRAQGLSDLGMIRSDNQKMLDTASRWGSGREEIIRRDYERGLKEADATSMADMIGSGMGASTLMTNAKSANRRNMGYMQQDALQTLSDQQLSTRLGVQQSGATASAQQRAMNLQQMAGRVGNRTQMELNNVDRNYNYGSVGTQMRQQLATSNIMNPWLNQNTTQYFPGMSPGGSALMNMGNTVSAVGPSMMAGMFAGGAGQQQVQPQPYSTYQPPLGNPSPSNRPR